MQQIAPGVYRAEGLRSANVYLLAADGGVVAIDTGWALDAGPLLAQLQESGYLRPRLRGVVLTHYHGDHVGNAAALAERTGAPVLAHRDEAPYIEQVQPPPAASSASRVLGWLGAHVLLRSAPCRVDRSVEDGDRTDALGGLRVIHTPGHTPGSICLYEPERQILFCGDTLFNVHPITGRRGLGLHMRLLTLDAAQRRASARRLAELPIRVLCCGHGEPIIDGAAEQLRALFAGEAA